VPKRLVQGGAVLAIVVVCLLVGGNVETDAQSTALPSGWASRDIGSSTPRGSARESGETWTIVGGGDNVWGAADEFHFAYRAITGDVDISARVASFDAANQWSKAGVMIRDALTANARNAFALVSPGTGAAMQQRTATGGATTRTESGAATTWVRLVRQGSRFTAYRSTDGRFWTTIASTTISMPSTVYVGLAVTSRDPAQVATATFSSLQIGTALPTPWRNHDVGSPDRTGTAASTGAGAFSVTGAGAAIWGNADEFQYVYQAVQGNAEIIARVASLKVTHVGAKAGVMIRESMSAGARHASMFATGGNGWSFQYRDVTNGLSFTSPGPGGSAPGWVRLVRAGNVFTAYHSTDGKAWSLVGSESIAMTSSVYVGLAVGSRVSTVTTTGTFTNVAVSHGSSGTNTPPTVSITSPSSGATFTAPASMTIVAAASDSDGAVARVDLYLGSTLLKSDITTPYSVAVTGVAAGTYQLTAVARDNDGATRTSSAVTVTVSGTTTTQPTKVVFVPSANHATSVTSYSVAIRRASDAATATPVATRNLGKPTVQGGEITVDISTLVNPLPAGSYYAIVSAIGPGGTTPSQKSANFTR
jgi:regulation of enolase protein 1 (concanavalin A-like superfamily)